MKASLGGVGEKKPCCISSRPRALKTVYLGSVEADGSTRPPREELVRRMTVTHLVPHKDWRRGTAQAGNLNRKYIQGSSLQLEITPRKTVKLSTHVSEVDAQLLNVIGPLYH